MAAAHLNLKEKNIGINSLFGCSTEMPHFVGFLVFWCWMGAHT